MPWLKSSPLRWISRAGSKQVFAMLDAHSIAWRSSAIPSDQDSPDSAQPASSGQFSEQEKVALYHRLFRDHEDVYILR